MAAYFFDSSAIVKRYLTEVGSGWVIGIADLAVGNEIYLARVTFVEVIYDAIQLAAALEINANIIKAARSSAIRLVSKDGALNTAAIAEGLAVDDPNTHP